MAMSIVSAPPRHCAPTWEAGANFDRAEIRMTVLPAAGEGSFYQPGLQNDPSIVFSTNILLKLQGKVVNSKVGALCLFKSNDRVKRQFYQIFHF